MSNPRTFSWEEARRLRGEGLTYKEISQRLGVNREAVRQACMDSEALRSLHKAANEYRRRGSSCPVCGDRMDSRSARCKSCVAGLQHEAEAVLIPQPGDEQAVCKGCGARFSRSDRHKVYCSLSCRRRRRASTRKKLLEGGSASWYSVTLSLRERETESWFTCVGEGKSRREARALADAQIPSGDWETMSVSTPSSIYRDLQRTA